MGTLTLAAHGPLYVDTNLIIYRVEHVQPYLSASMPLWDALRDGTHQVITSELSLLETIVKPIQLDNLTLQHRKIPKQMRFYVQATAFRIALTAVIGHRV